VLLVTRAVRRSGKASALVLILAGVIGLGAVLTGAHRISSFSTIYFSRTARMAADEMLRPRPGKLVILQKRASTVIVCLLCGDVVHQRRGFWRAQSH